MVSPRGRRGHNIRTREIAQRRKLKLSEYSLFHAECGDLVVAPHRGRDLRAAGPLQRIPLLLSPAPAQAANRGGCTDHPTSAPCISYRDGYVYSDIYQNRTPDSSTYKAALMIYVKGKHVQTKWYEPIARTGRHGPISRNVQTLPNPSGNAYTKLRVYTSSGALHFEVNSPVVYYPDQTNVVGSAGANGPGTADKSSRVNWSVR